MIVWLIIVLVCVYFASRRVSRRHRSNRLEKLWQESVYDDDAAREIIQTLSDTPVWKPEDYLLYGRVSEYNINGGNTRQDPSVYINGALAVTPATPHRVREDLAYELFEHDQIDLAIRLSLDTMKEKKAKKPTPATPASGVQFHLDNAGAIPSDPQNVHDGALGFDLRFIADKLAMGQSTPLGDLLPDIMRATGELYDVGERKYKNVQDVLTLFARGDPISGFDQTEDQILASVWKRCDDPNNTQRRDLMRQAVVVALADCVEHDRPVCAKGRVARVLNSLVTLDHDDTVSSGAMTYHAYKNQIMKQCEDVFNAELELAAASDDPKMVDLAACYTDISRAMDIPDEDAEVEFKSNVSRKMDIVIDSYAEKIQPAALSMIRLECRNAITLDD